MYKSCYKLINKCHCFAKVRKDGEIVRITRQFVNNAGDYVLNEFGHIRNDFSQLVKTQDALGMQMALNQLQDKFGDGLPEDMSFEEAVATIRPRFVQSPAELDKFELYLIDHATEFYKKMKKDIDDDTAKAIAEAEKKQQALIDKIKAQSIPFKDASATEA